MAQFTCLQSSKEILILVGLAEHEIENGLIVVEPKHPFFTDKNEQKMAVDFI